MATATHALVELAPEVREACGLDPVGYPIRSSALRRIRHGDRTDLGLLLEEVDRFLEAHPEMRWLYRDDLCLLAYYGAKAAASREDHAEVVRFCEVGLAQRPRHLGMHALTGAALHALGEHAAAMDHFDVVLQHPRADADVVVRLVATRSLVQLGRAWEAVLLAWPPPTGLEFDDRWYRYACWLCDEAGVAHPTRPDPAAERAALLDEIDAVPLPRGAHEAVADRYLTRRALRAASIASLRGTDGLDTSSATRLFAHLHPNRVPPELRPSS